MLAYKRDAQPLQNRNSVTEMDYSQGKFWESSSSVFFLQQALLKPEGKLWLPAAGTDYGWFQTAYVFRFRNWSLTGFSCHLRQTHFSNWFLKEYTYLFRQWQFCHVWEACLSHFWWTLLPFHFYSLPLDLNHKDGLCKMPCRQGASVLTHIRIFSVQTEHYR